MFVTVLGIDPGLTRCGYGFVAKSSDRKLSLKNAGVLTTSAQEQLSSRLSEMNNDLTSLIGELKPDVIAIERVRFAANVTTAMSVAQVSGLVHSIAAGSGIEVIEYSPSEIKSAITGDGRADKKQVQDMVQRMLNLDFIPQPADAADAIAIALTHIGAIPIVGNANSDSAIYNGSNLHNYIADAIYKKAKEKKKIIEPHRHEPQRRVRKRPGLVR